MRLPRFRYVAPSSLGEAIDVLASASPGDAMIVAGGTDVIPNMKRRQQTPGTLVGLRGIPELQRVQNGDGLSIGAGVTLTRLASELDSRHAIGLTGLRQAVLQIATPHLRNMGTVGGNLCLDTRCNYYDQNYEWRQAIDFCMKKDGTVCWVAPGSPRCLAVQSADSVPILIALRARAVLASPEGERELPLEDLYANDGIHYLTKRPDELLTQIRVPAPDGWTASYRKLRRRGTFDFPVLAVGAAVRREGERVAESRIVLGAVASAPVRASGAEAALMGRALDEAAIAQAAAAAAAVSRPMDNTDFSFLWRKEMTGRWVGMALTDLARGAARPS